MMAPIVDDERVSCLDDPRVAALDTLTNAYIEDATKVEEQISAIKAQFSKMEASLQKEMTAELGAQAVEGFWLEVLEKFLNLVAEPDMIEERDEPILKALKSISYELIEEGNHDAGFKLIFEWGENQWFENERLVKIVHATRENYIEAPRIEIEIEAPIKWKADQDVTVAKTKKKGTKKPCASFFRTFFCAFDGEDEAGEAFLVDEDLKKMEVDIADLEDEDIDAEKAEIYEKLVEESEWLAVHMKNDMIPYAIKFYTGEMDQFVDADDVEDYDEESGMVPNFDALHALKKKAVVDVEEMDDDDDAMVGA